MSVTTLSRGMFPSDIVLRTGILAAIADLRSPQSEWQLQFIWNYLAQDDLTKEQYGDNEINRGIEWFKKSEIKVFVAGQLDNIETPCVHISLLDSAEVESTMGDIAGDPQPQENFVMDPMPAQDPIVLTARFDGLYTVGTGNVLLPANIGSSVDIFPGMVLANTMGQTYEILDIVDSNNILIQSGITPDLHNVVVQSGGATAYKLSLESAHFRETYRLGCLVDSEPVHLIYLHSLISYILLRYRRFYFEPRGFERMTISSSDFRKDSSLAPEVAYMRFITVQGTVIQTWPSAFNAKVAGIYTAGKVGTVLQNSNSADVTANMFSDQT